MLGPADPGRLAGGKTPDRSVMRGVLCRTVTGRSRLFVSSSTADADFFVVFRVFSPDLRGTMMIA